MSSFASVEDVAAMWRALSPGEIERAEKLLPIISDILRSEADKVGKDLDAMVVSEPTLASAAKSVTVDVLARALMTPTDETPMTQMSQSGLGYTVSGTFLVPGGGLFIKNAELARLGLKRQRAGVIEPYETAGDYSHFI